MKILSVKQVAEKLNTAEITIRRYISRGDLPAHRMGIEGSRILIYEDELDEWLGRREPVKHSREMTVLEGGRHGNL